MEPLNTTLDKEMGPQTSKEDAAKPVIGISGPLENDPNVTYLLYVVCACGNTYSLKIGGEGDWLLVADITLFCETCKHSFTLNKSIIRTLDNEILEHSTTR